jgi:hypothetical protein
MQKIKSHLLIDNKFLGSLLHFKDASGRGCLKLSFQNKIADFVMGTDVPTTLPAPAKLSDPITLDVSYKFDDSLLEVKKMINGKPDRAFYKIPLPISDMLFMIRIKDWHLLDDDQGSKSSLVLTPPSQDGKVAIIFSFLGENGLPFVPAGYVCPMGMGTISLPENPLSTFCIGIAEDPGNSEANGFIIQIPFSRTP